MRRTGGEEVFSAKGLKQRRLHKAFLRYHDAENWPLLREALKRMGRADLIGPGKHQLVPTGSRPAPGLGGGEGARPGPQARDPKILHPADDPVAPPGIAPPKKKAGRRIKRADGRIEAGGRICPTERRACGQTTTNS